MSLRQIDRDFPWNCSTWIAQFGLHPSPYLSDELAAKTHAEIKIQASSMLKTYGWTPEAAIAVAGFAVQIDNTATSVAKASLFKPPKGTTDPNLGRLSWKKAAEIVFTNWKLNTVVDGMLVKNLCDPLSIMKIIQAQDVRLSMFLLQS